MYKVGADVHTNQFSVLDVEEGVDTHDCHDEPVTAGNDVSCVVRCGCACKGSVNGERL